MALSVDSGLDLLLQERLASLSGRRVGLLCHAASVDRRLRHAPDLLVEAGVQLACLFGPEHGVDAAAQDMIGVRGDTHPRLKIPVYSLYGSAAEDLSPRAEQLHGLHTLVIDLQDVGSRYYTYVWTMVLSLRACARGGVAALVLDRPNPLGGQAIEGPTVLPGYSSFVGLYPVPTRHGLTAGELARLVTQEERLDLDLQVIPARGWRRSMFFDQTGLPWVLPSPNMPTPDTALVYPGGCLLEGTNLSEGRGTTRPFEIFGAPWMDGRRLAAALEREQLPGVSFRPLCFTPTFHKHAGTLCGGVQLHVTARRRYQPLRTGVACLLHTHRLWPYHFGWRDDPYEFVADVPAIDLLAGGPWLRQGVEEDRPLDYLCAAWPAAEAAFAERRAPHLLYGDAP